VRALAAAGEVERARQEASLVEEFAKRNRVVAFQAYLPDLPPRG
jgi:hypothetical protein